jgi:phosphatidyl-myo-inositol alpha-mannosyltransferase
MFPTDSTRIRREHSLPAIDDRASDRSQHPHDPLRVALLNPVFWPEVRRGSERVINDLATGLTASGHLPRVITGHPGPRAESSEYGYPVLRVRRRSERLVRRAGYHEYVGHVPASYLALRRGHDDIAHAFYPFDALAATGWSRGNRRPAIFSLMGMPPRESVERKRARRALWRHLARRASALVTLSEAARESLSWWSRELRVIYPGVDTNAFQSTAERAAVPMILCPAAIEERRKRIDLVIQAFELLRRRWPELRLVLARPRATSRRTGSRRPGIELRDLDDHAALVRAYSEAWVTVLASEEEAFGLVLVESLACGTPVVGRRDGGAAEIIDREDVGRLFDGDSATRLADAIATAIELADARSTGAACRERATRFSTQRALAAHLDLYREVLG